MIQISDKRYRELEADAHAYHRVMALMRAQKMEHGKCTPRENRACANCNSVDDLRKMLAEYKGARIVLAADFGAQPIGVKS